MPNSDMKTIRILNIIACVLTSLAIVGFVIGGSLMVVAGSYVDSDSFMGLLKEEIQEHPNDMYFDDEYLDGPGYGYNFDDDFYDEATDVASAAIAVIGVLVIFAALLSVIPLIASIIGIRNASRAKKMGVIFGWGIAGAVVCFLTGRWITCVLFIIAAVKASSVKKGYAAAEAAGYVADPYAPAPEAPQFISYGQPAQPAPQVQPVQQPVAQPVQQAQPVQYYQVPVESAQPAQPQPKPEPQPAQQASEIQYYTPAATYVAPEQTASQQDTPQQ